LQVALRFVGNYALGDFHSRYMTCPSYKIIEVPEKHFYMLGDNPAESFDSRYWDDPFVHEDDILARLFIQ